MSIEAADDRRTYDVLRNRGVETAAEVTDVEDFGRSGVQVSVSFEVDGRRMTHELHDPPEELSTHDKVRVVYDPSDPSTVAVRGQTSAFTGLTVVAASCAVAGLGGVVGLWLGRPRRNSVPAGSIR